MPIHNFPFTSIRPGDTPRAWLPIRIINPTNGLIQNAYGLIDTGADECSIPASYASLETPVCLEGSLLSSGSIVLDLNGA